MKYLILAILFGCGTSGSNSILNFTNKEEINLLHYNIKELSSEKLESPSSPQIDSVAKVIRKIEAEHGQIDIFSVNEIQFDKVGIPNKKYTSTGQNLNKLSQRLEMKFKHTIFSEANTGKLAKLDKNGEYPSNFGIKNARNLADQVNFGLFPGQYSTGALSNLKVISVNVIDKLRWKQFNPTIDLSQYRLANGKKVPEDTQLFDKSFTDVLLETPKGKRFHLILLHTVPAYHFGNKKTVNYVRNGDQLRFLEWYLTGKTDIGVPKLIDDGNRISPLPPGSRFVAVGDWNTSVHNTDNPGSWVLKRLFKLTNPWIKMEEMKYSTLGKRFQDGKGFMLDYIVTDKQTKIIKGTIKQPLSESEFATYFSASDHLPTFLKFQL